MDKQNDKGLSETSETTNSTYNPLPEWSERSSDDIGRPSTYRVGFPGDTRDISAAIRRQARRQLVDDGDGLGG